MAIAPGKLQFRVLGPLEVDAGGGAIPLGGPKQRAVLAHLLLRANQLVPAETLVDEIWGDESPQQARNIIQTYVSHLRKALGRDRIESHAPGYRLLLDPSELDATRFDALMRAARKALPVDPDIAVAAIDDALAIWRGPALADLADQQSLLTEAARLDQLRLEAQEVRIEGLLASGIQTRAIGELEILLARHPWRESLWGLLMLAYYREGRQADALSSYQRAREILADQLGIDPTPELLKLHGRILKQDPGLDLRGEPLRGYRLLEKIDDGPTGVVFRAIQPHVERDVAVKIFHEATAGAPEFVRRFGPDAQAIAALEHPHIAPIYDYWREPGRAYIVSRYLRGGSLRAIGERGEPLERDRALRVVEQVSLALAFAHRQGIAHGNVRSSNILFDLEGNAYLGDFLIGSGPARAPAEDVRELALLVERLLPNETSLSELAERAALASGAPEAHAFAVAARAALEPTASVPPRRAEERNPYKGLRAFTEADALDFFGREQLTRRLITRLRETEPGSRFLAVVGPSGGGKSSVVRAGLVPAIRHWALGGPEEPFIAEMFPGSHPLDELEASLLRIAVRPVSRLRERLDSGSRGLLEAVDLVAPGQAEVVLVVDQFEELFTLTTDEGERGRFLEALRVAAADPESRLRVIVTLRADFYDRPLIYPRFGELLADRTEAVPPLTPDELEQAIRGPAERVGIRPEPGLVAEMIADVAHQPGALPLLQYALTELFERRDEDRLTLIAYQELGGITGALSARAERIFEATDQQGRRVTKQTFLRLVTLGEGRQDTRRRVARSELDALDVDQEAIDVVLGSFGRHRLLTFDREPSTREPTVEIAHEALLSAWGRLRTWIDDARGDLRQERGLARAAAEWRGSGGDPSFLIRGARLDQLETWAATTDLAIGRPERAYLKASVDQREREHGEEERRREHEGRIERRSARRLRGLVAVFAAAALIAGSLTVVATSQSKRAQLATRLATARELAAAAEANVDVDPQRSMLLALAAADVTGEDDLLPEVEDALRRSLTEDREVLTIEGLPDGLLAISPDGNLLVTRGPVAGVPEGEDPGFVVHDLQTGTALQTLAGELGGFTDLAYSPDGTRLAALAPDSTLIVWETRSWSREWTVDLGRTISYAGGLSFSPDGRLLAAVGGDGIVSILDASSGREIRTMRWPETGLLGVAFSPDGRLVGAAPNLGDRAEATPIWDVRTGRRVMKLKSSGSSKLGIAFSPDGRSIAISDFGGFVRMWNARTGVERDEVLEGQGAVWMVAYSPDGQRIASAGDDGVHVWDAEDGRELMFFRGHEEAVFLVGFTPDGERLVTGGGHTVRVWDVSRSGGGELLTIGASDEPVASVAFSPGGSRLLTAGGEVRQWDARTGEPMMAASLDGWNEAVYNPDGDRFATAGGTLISSSDSGQELLGMDIGSADKTWSVAYSPDGRSIAGGMGEGQVSGLVFVWDAETGERIQTLGEPGSEYDHIRGLTFGPDGARVAGIAYSGGAHIWDVASGEELLSFDTGGDNTGGIALSPDGTLLATSGGDGAALWNADSGELVVRLRGHTGDVPEVVFSSDGTLVATASEDGTARIWDVSTGRSLHTLFGHEGSVTGVAFSPDDTTVATSGVDGTVREYALGFDDLVRIARSRLTRSLSSAECQRYLHTTSCPASV